jgi:hypothetical protein
LEGIGEPFISKQSQFNVDLDTISLNNLSIRINLKRLENNREMPFSLQKVPN